MTERKSPLPLLLALALIAYAFGWFGDGGILPSPTPPDVPNDYGVGMVAYKEAPKDGKASEVSDIYERSADFLYGVPSLKFIVSSDSADDGDPKRSVLAWQEQEMPSGWDAWLKDVREAFEKSQERTQFKRSDWRDAFLEVSKALEAVD